MLAIIITFSLLLVLRVDGIEPETGQPPTRAVSTQSYHRGDVPLSYTVTSYHDYIKPQTRVPIYAVNNHIPQYQPPKTTNEHYHKINQPPLQPAHEEQQKLSLLIQNHPNENNLQIAEKYIHNNYLEPRLVENYELTNYNKQRSFVPGHNVAVAPNSRYRSTISKDPYKKFQELEQSQMVLPKYIINKKQKQPLLIQSQTIQTDSETQHLENAGFPVIPKQNYHVPQYAHTHDRVLFPQQPPRAPRLHLNIGRVYGVAHIPYQAHGPVLNKEKPLSHTQAIIKPYPESVNKDKTVLYPVQDFQRYPIHVV